MGRLHRPSASHSGVAPLRRSLTEIGHWLANRDVSLGKLIARQVDDARRQRDRLVRQQTPLAAGEAPKLAEGLRTPEMMNMYDKYFSKDELARFPLYQNTRARESDWPAIVAEVNALMASGEPSTGEAAQAVSRRWMKMMERDTGGDARLLAKLNTMHLSELSVQTQTGITQDLMEYIEEAFAQTKLRIYRKYLNDNEFRFMQANYLTYTYEWPVLVGAVREQLEAGSPPDAPEVQTLVRQWLTYFRSYAGDDPATHAKIREANMREPELMSGTLIDARLLTYVKQGMAALMRR